MKKLSMIFKSLQKSFDQRGFTLIELLVVIGVLGILATGLLATIDPLEQFRKGSDSNKRTTALELQNAITRYYAVHGTLPWDSTTNGGAGCNGGVAPAPTRVTPVQTGTTTSFNDCLTTLVNEGELKSTFPTQNSILNALWVVDTTPANSSSKSFAICFNPDSKSESTKPETKYNGTASGPTVPLDPTCDPTLPASSCYTCAQ